MERDLNATVRYKYQPQAQSSEQSGDMMMTMWDGNHEPRTISLSAFQKSVILFGRDPRNDIQISSQLVSHQHGRIVFRNGQWIIEDSALYSQKPSLNGLIYNHRIVAAQAICDGTVIRIDNGMESIPQGVLMVFCSQKSGNKWNSVDIMQKQDIRIGRSGDNDIVLPHVSVSKAHARIIRAADGWYIIDANSRNGVVVNDRVIMGKEKLHEKDIISITNTKLIFTSQRISYCCFKNGVSVDASDVVIKRGRGRKSFITGNHVDINIQPGELVAIIGGSGAGKSTILNSMCGYLKPASGDVFINGVNLYKNFNSLKNLIGYVPQSDIVYDNLTLKDMLLYTAKLRLPADVSPAEREQAIDRAISLVELTEKKGSLIKSLSGGQKKRASIAVELLSDPNLLFLDEPASGLDPGTERNLMTSLRRMADSGKTIILVTHSTLQLQLCDKIVFMGKGGNLCYFGSLKDALAFFGVSDVVDVYNMITDNAPYWKSRFDATKNPSQISQNQSPRKEREAKKKKSFQLPVLCGRYLKLIFNDKQRLRLLLLQAPLLALLISLVADGQEFEQYEMTKSLLFALSCSAFWVGMLNAIQEICKERNITKREYMTGLSLTSYVLSKIIVLGLLCMVQSILLVAVFALTVGMPEEGIMMFPIVEMLITTFLTAIASAAMGLFVSSLFTNADRAMTVAPILLMPQILFSGLIFTLDGVTKTISWLAVCRWSMEGYGTTANLNSLQLKLQQQGLNIVHEVEDFFDFTVGHMVKSWLLLILFVVIFLGLARLVLSTIGKEKG